MDGDLGALGFWLFLAAIVIASTWKGRQRESDIQETIRAATDKDGKVDPALIELLRERDAAAAKLQRDMWMIGWKPGPVTAATIVLVLSLVLGGVLFVTLSPGSSLPRMTPPHCFTQSPPPSCDVFFQPRSELGPKLVAFAALATIWLGGFAVAAWIVMRFRKKEPPPAA